MPEGETESGLFSVTWEGQGSDRETGSVPSLEGPSEAASWRAPSCEPWVTWPQGWGSEVTTVTKWPCPPSPVPLLLPPPPPPPHSSHKHFSGTFFVWNAAPCCINFLGRL